MIQYGLKPKMQFSKFRKTAETLAGRMTDDELTGMICYESEAVARLSINGYNWWNEASHGVARNGVATVFPCPTARKARRRFITV